MSSYEELTQKLIDDAVKADDDTVLNDRVKALKTLAETQKLLEPEPTPVPEPDGVKGFFHRHTDALIKVGGTVIAIFAVAAVETKGDVIFRSKASKYI